MALDTVYCILDTKQKPVHTSTFPRMEKNKCNYIISIHFPKKERWNLKLKNIPSSKLTKLWKCSSINRAKNSGELLTVDPRNFPRCQSQTSEASRRHRASAQKQLECPWKHRVEGPSWAVPGRCFSAALSCHDCKNIFTDNISEQVKLYLHMHVYLM